MSDKKNIALLVPDGVGIKNYLYTNLFANFPADLNLYHNFDRDTLNEINKSVPLSSEVTLAPYRESIREKLLRELIHLSRLKNNAKKTQNPTILKFWKRGHKGFKLKLFYKIVEVLSNRYSSYDRIASLEKKYSKAIRKNPFYDKMTRQLLADKPDCVFCTHQRALNAPAFFAAAYDLGIKTVTVIYSWDNIPKARLALRANQYLVWSQHMKEELQYFYPEISEESIVITGTPQFEFYTDASNIEARETFYEKHNLNPSKQIICFSGDDVKTSPYDPHYLNDLATQLTASKLDSNFQIAFRRCPVDTSDRYDWVLKKFPELIKSMPPKWNFNARKWSAVYPTRADVTELVSLAYYADVVLNVGSTMAFDFGMFKKPCVYINYDHKQDANWSVDTIYKYQHFRSMPNQNSVFWLNSPEQVPQVFGQLLVTSETAIEAWFHIVVNHATEASENIKKILLQ